jgi:hypothetical protein
MDGKVLLAFILGIAAGAGGTYFYLKPKYEAMNAENLEVNRKFYEEKLKEATVEDDQTTPTEQEIESAAQENAQHLDQLRKADELASKLNYNALYNKQPLTAVGSEEKMEDQVYLIAPDQYESESLYDRRTLTYYEGDDVLCDELTEEILDIENTIGIENVDQFGNPFEEDPYVMHIRNNKFGCVYEVFKDERSYSAVMGEDG